MRIVEHREPTLLDSIRGTPLNVVFADSESIAAVRESGHGRLPLVPPFHVSDADAYVVLPDDIGLELVDMFRDGDVDLLEEAARDGLVAIGTVEREGRSEVVLEVERCARLADALAALAWVENVGIGRGIDPTPVLNQLDAVQCTVASAFVGRRGLAAMLTSNEFAGTSWRVPADQKHLAHTDPTYAWSKRLPDGRISIECALFLEYEELVVVLKPAVLTPLDAIELGAASNAAV